MGRSVEVGVGVGFAPGSGGEGVKHGKWRQREKLLHKDTKAVRNAEELQKREG